MSKKAIVSLAAMAASTSSVWAQCAAPECSEFPAIAIPEEEDPLVPDRRPVGVVQLYTGSYLSNDAGLNPFWCRGATMASETSVDLVGAPGEGSGSPNGIPDSFDYLLARLQHAYGDGFRRIVISLPAGYCEDNLDVITVPFSNSQFYTMPSWKRAGFATYVKSWVDTVNDSLLSSDPEFVRVGLYSGFSLSEIPDACDTCAADDEWHYPQTNSSDDMCVFWQNTINWEDSGIIDHWFDYAGNTYGSASTLHALGYSSLYNGIFRFGGEGIPVVFPGSVRTIDTSLIGKIPWVGLQREADLISNWTGVSPTSNSEVGVWYSGHVPFDIHAVQSYFSVGCVAWCTIADVAGASPANSGAEYIKRVYNWHWTRPGSMTEPLAIEDLNCDGVVDCLDWDQIWFYFMTADATLYHGDLDGDGDVDMDDIDILDFALGSSC